MKVAIIAYHKNIDTLYPKEWIEQYKASVLSHGTYPIYECCYGGESKQIFEHSTFLYKAMPTFVHAMNELIDTAFAHGFDAVANTNVDDYYAADRIEQQVTYLTAGYDIVSSNFALIQDGRQIARQSFHNLNIRAEIMHGHNIIAHPAVMYSKRFWEGNKYDPNEIPREDLKLWQRSVAKYKFGISPHILLYHRVHDNAVSKKNQRLCIR